MNARFRFTDSEINKILKNLTIIIDGREKKADIYRGWFEKNNIEYIDSLKMHEMRKKGYFSLDMGDYSCMLPAGSIPGIDRDIFFDREIVIEKKADIRELAGNLSEEKGARIKKEFSHINKYGTTVYIFMCDPLFYKHLEEGKEKHIGRWSKDTLKAQFKSFEAMYNTKILPISNEFVAEEIYQTLYHHVRNILKREFYLEKFLIE